jgi:hypothetical protein
MLSLLPSSYLIYTFMDFLGDGQAYFCRFFYGVDVFKIRCEVPVLSTEKTEIFRGRNTHPDMV